ncbi:substrate-binding periplasmic protein [Chitinimonas koreensis]|uniref:substrate-binding periplasmic protein n=1 Tax=Chitinimonas koreensis TaxID=356302 RepID=UPI000491C2AD|nr:transporter substrate-binding domain-containing protein [Chitinimonas koreensis]QNM96646.1 transporter substrate-binding domain-containing protein [Chitinimonas koreensis]
MRAARPICLLAALAWSALGMAARLAPLRVAVGLSLPPYVIRERGAGLEYEQVAEALRRAGYAMQPVYVAYGQIGAVLDSRRVDAAMTLNPASGVAAHYSRPVVSYTDYAITLKRRAIVVKRPDDLLGYSVLAFQNARVELGPAYAEMARRHQRYGETGQQVLQVKLLYSGKVDVVVSDRMIFNYYRDWLAAEMDVVEPLDYQQLFPPIDYSVAFRDAPVRDRFDAALEAMRRDGSLERIRAAYRRYF